MNMARRLASIVLMEPALNAGNTGPNPVGDTN